MRLRYAVLGSGRVGAAIARDLALHGGGEVLVADNDTARLEALARGFGRGRLAIGWAEFAEPATIRPLQAGVRVVVSAAPCRFNPALARHAVDLGVSFLDLGGNTDAVDEVLRLGSQARRRGCLLLPDCGLAPGLSNVLAGEAVRRLGGRADEVRIWVGGIPPRPEGPLRHRLFFSFEGLLHEYTAPARVLKRGRIALRPALSAPEAFAWNAFLPLEAFRTGGSSSTLPDTFAGRVGTLEVKTIRHAGHREAVVALRRRAGARGFPAALAAALRAGGTDRVLMRVLARRGRRAVRIELFARGVGARTAMVRTTAAPTAIAAVLAARGRLGPPGPKIHERDIPAGVMIRALARAGIRIRIRMEEP